MVQFFFQKAAASLKERTRLKAFLVSLFKIEKRKMDSLTYIFCSDDELLEINKQFLQHDYYTDIITFNLAPEGEAIAGEIYISIDRVVDNAKLHSVSLKEELHRVIFHGALHLCGYKDKTVKDEKEMRAAENRYLISYFK